MRHIFRSSLSVYIQLRRPEEQVYNQYKLYSFVYVKMTIKENFQFSVTYSTCFQNVVLPIRYVRGDKLLFHLIFRMLLYRNRGNSIAVCSWRIRSSRLLWTRLDSNMHFGKCDICDAYIAITLLAYQFFYIPFFLTGFTCLYEFNYQ